MPRTSTRHGEVLSGRVWTGIEAVPWHPGRKYLVKYQIPGAHRVPRFMLAAYVGRSMGNVLAFSGRPTFGDTGLSPDWVQEVSLVPDDDTREPFIDRKSSS